MNRKASSEILERLAFNMKRLRAAQGWTQRDLAERCGFHRTYVGQVEQERINLTVANLEEIARAFGVDADQILKRIPHHEHD